MAIFLKTGSPDAEKAEENNSIKSAVEATLSGLEDRKRSCRERV